MQTDNDILVGRARQGDASAFAKLYEGIYKRLYYYALANLNNQDDAKDVVSDTVLDAFRGIKNLKNPKAFESWIFKILIAKIKKQQKSYVEENNNTAVEHSDIDMTEIADQYYIHSRFDEYSGVELLSEFEKLPYKYRLCITLNVLYGYTSEEISMMTEINASTVRTYISRGKISLREALT